MDFSLELGLTISDYRLIEKKIKSKEVFTETENHFGCREGPLNENEKNQPIFFTGKIDEYIVERTYYYNLPDSNVYAIIYEFENLHGAMNGTYPIDTFHIDKMPTEKYLKCQFQNITDKIVKKVGNYDEYENFGTVREWKLSNKKIQLNLTLGQKENRRLRLVIYDEKPAGNK
jgi:hypothetical protein